MKKLESQRPEPAPAGSSSLQRDAGGISFRGGEKVSDPMSKPRRRPGFCSNCNEPLNPRPGRGRHVYDKHECAVEGRKEKQAGYRLKNQAAQRSVLLSAIGPQADQRIKDLEACERWLRNYPELKQKYFADPASSPTPLRSFLVHMCLQEAPTNAGEYDAWIRDSLLAAWQLFMEKRERDANRAAEILLGTIQTRPCRKKDHIELECKEIMVECGFVVSTSLRAALLKVIGLCYELIVGWRRLNEPRRQVAALLRLANLYRAYPWIKPQSYAASIELLKAADHLLKLAPTQDLAILLLRREQTQRKAQLIISGGSGRYKREHTAVVTELGQKTERPIAIIHSLVFEATHLIACGNTAAADDLLSQAEREAADQVLPRSTDWAQQEARIQLMRKEGLDIPESVIAKCQRLYDELPCPYRLPNLQLWLPDEFRDRRRRGQVASVALPPLVDFFMRDL